MPITAPLSKVANTMRLGATIVQHGATLAEAMERLPDLLAGGATLVHPYDDPLVVAGQGTAAVEFFADVADLGLPELDVLVVPVGGGGLLTGCALAANHLAPRCEVLGVQTESYPFLAAALRGGEFAATPVPAGLVSIADGIAVKQPGQIARAVLPGLGVGCVTVSEGRIEEAIGLLVEVEKTVAEGAGAAPLAAVLDDPERFAGRRVGLLLTGGNIDPRLLSSVLQRALVRQGRLTRLRVETDDLPGNLARIATVIGREGGNLIEVTHQRLLSGAPARRVDIDFLIETLDAAHLGRIRAALAANGDTAGDLGLMEP
jgi:threonine dehydratase